MSVGGKEVFRESIDFLGWTECRRKVRVECRWCKPYQGFSVLARNFQEAFLLPAKGGSVVSRAACWKEDRLNEVKGVCEAGNLLPSIPCVCSRSQLLMSYGLEAAVPCNTSLSTGPLASWLAPERAIKT